MSDMNDDFQVMHDCRLASDMLHHQYDVGLINVFDTQVSILIYKHVSCDLKYWMGLSPPFLYRLLLSSLHDGWYKSELDNAKRGIP